MGEQYVLAKLKHRYRSPVRRYQCPLASLIRCVFSLFVLQLVINVVFRARILADPTSFEEPLLDTSVSVVVDEKGSLISVTQLGLASSGPGDTLSHCIAAAKKRRSYLETQAFI
jgi:exosome complex component RRP43